MSIRSLVDDPAKSTLIKLNLLTFGTLSEYRGAPPIDALLPPDPWSTTVPIVSPLAGAPPPESVSPVPSPIRHQPKGLSDDMSLGTPLLYTAVMSEANNAELEESYCSEMRSITGKLMEIHDCSGTRDINNKIREIRGFVNDIGRALPDFCADQGWNLD